MVYVEEVEYGITRLAAVFSSQVPRRIGPIRSARITDIDLFAQYGKPAFGYSGAQRKMFPYLRAASIYDVSPYRATPATAATTAAACPTTCSSTAGAGVKRAPKATTARDMGFVFDEQVPDGGLNATRASMAWGYASAGFDYDRKDEEYRVSLNGQPARAEEWSGGQRAATVVIQYVKQTRSPFWDKGGGNTPHAETIGKGTAMVLRDGRVWKTTWTRPNAKSGTTFTLRDGSLTAVQARPAVDRPARQEAQGDDHAADQAQGGQTSTDGHTSTDGTGRPGCTDTRIANAPRHRDPILRQPDTGQLSEGATMALTVDKKTGILAGIIAALVAALAFLVVVVAILAGALIATSGSVDVFGMGAGEGHGMGMHDAETGSGDLTGSDVMFLQMMIPHHQQAVDMSDLALARSTDAELLALAQEIRDGQASEIVQMQGWLSDAGLPGELDHSMGMGMGGMLTETELQALADSQGEEFDRLWLTGMIQHHLGALHMIEMIEDSPNPDIEAFGASIDTVQTTQIEQMSAMLERVDS